MKNDDGRRNENKGSQMDDVDTNQNNKDNQNINVITIRSVLDNAIPKIKEIK